MPTSPQQYLSNDGVGLKIGRVVWPDKGTRLDVSATHDVSMRTHEIFLKFSAIVRKTIQFEILCTHAKDRTLIYNMKYLFLEIFHRIFWKTVWEIWIFLKVFFWSSFGGSFHGFILNSSEKIYLEKISDSYGKWTFLRSQIDNCSTLVYNTREFMSINTK